MSDEIDWAEAARKAGWPVLDTEDPEFETRLARVLGLIEVGKENARKYETKESK